MTGSPNLSTFSLPGTGRADFVCWSCKVGANSSVYVTAVIAGGWAVGVDGSVPDTNDKVDETVVDRCDLEPNPSTFFASSCEAFAPEPCLPLPVSAPCWASSAF